MSSGVLSSRTKRNFVNTPWGGAKREGFQWEKAFRALLSTNSLAQILIPDYGILVKPIDAYARAANAILVTPLTTVLPPQPDDRERIQYYEKDLRIISAEFSKGSGFINSTIDIGPQSQIYAVQNNDSLLQSEKFRESFTTLRNIYKDGSNEIKAQIMQEIHTIEVAESDVKGLEVLASMERLKFELDHMPTTFQESDENMKGYLESRLGGHFLFFTDKMSANIAWTWIETGKALREFIDKKMSKQGPVTLIGSLLGWCILPHDYCYIKNIIFIIIIIST